MNSKEKIEEILFRHWANPTTTRDETVKGLQTLCQEWERDAVMGFIASCGNYVFGKDLLREKAETYLQQDEDKHDTKPEN